MKTLTRALPFLAGALAAVLAARAGSSSKPTPAPTPLNAESPAAPVGSLRKAPSLKDAPAPHVAGQLLVAFENTEASAKRAALFAKHGVKEVEKVGSSELWLVNLPAGAKLEDVQKAISSEPGVRYAEPNLVMRTFKN